MTNLVNLQSSTFKILQKLLTYKPNKISQSIQQQNQTFKEEIITNWINNRANLFVTNQYYRQNDKNKQFLWRLYNNQSQEFKENYLTKKSTQIMINQLVQHLRYIFFADEHNYINSRSGKQKHTNTRSQLNTEFSQLIKGYKMITIQDNKDNKCNYLFNYPIKKSHPLEKNYNCGFNVPNLALSTIPQATHNKSYHYSNFNQQYSNSKVFIINPNISILNKMLMKPYIEEHLFGLVPYILLTNSNFDQVLSAIIYLYVYGQVFKDCVNKKQLKIITTKDIYKKYLQIMLFVKQLSAQLHLVQNHANNISVKQINEKLITQSNKPHNLHLKQQIQKLSNCIQHNFYIIQSNIPFDFQGLSICFKSPNLFPIGSYDLQISNLNDQLQICINGPYLKNVKNIYYQYKSKHINQRQYIEIVKRLQLKQTRQKQYWKYMRNGVNARNDKVIQSSNKQKSQLKSTLMFIDGTQRVFNRMKISKKSIFSTQTIQKPSLYHSPHQISVSKKNLCYPILRKIPQFNKLLDIQLIEILNDSIILQLDQNQLVYKQNMLLENVYLVIQGKCAKIKQNVNIVREGQLFGWHTFISEQDTKLWHITFQDRYKKDQKQHSLQVVSYKAVIMVISNTFLKFLLYDKLANIIYSILKDDDKLQTQNQFWQFLNN